MIKVVEVAFPILVRRDSWPGLMFLQAAGWDGSLRIAISFSRGGAYTGIASTGPGIFSGIVCHNSSSAMTSEWLGTTRIDGCWSVQRIIVHGRGRVGTVGMADNGSLHPGGLIYYYLFSCLVAVCMVHVCAYVYIHMCVYLVGRRQHNTLYTRSLIPQAFLVNRTRVMHCQLK